MEKIDYRAVEADLRLIASDPEGLQEAFRCRYPGLIEVFGTFAAPVASYATTNTEAVVPCPAIADLTAFQCTIWDNWLGDRQRKGKPNRYCATIQAWTGEGADLSLSRPNWVKSGDLIPADRIVSEAVRLSTTMNKKRTAALISPAYRDVLVELAERANGGYFALLRIKSKGTTYLDRNFVYLNFEDQTACLFNGGDGSIANGFATTTAKGRKLPVATDKSGKVTGRAIFQVRHDIAGFSSCWATETSNSLNSHNLL